MNNIVVDMMLYTSSLLKTSRRLIPVGVAHPDRKAIVYRQFTTDFVVDDGEAGQSFVSLFSKSGVLNKYLIFMLSCKFF